MNTETKSAGSSILWAAVGALSVAVIALGALLYTKSQPSAPLGTPAAESAAPATTPAASAAATATAPAAQPSAKAPAKHATGTAVAPAAPKTAAPAAPAANGTAAPSTKPVCANCATVTSVTPVEREGAASGAGAVAGGVLGALVGNQFGQGGGKTATTVLGAVGGGYAGNEVEKRMKKVTVYQVHLRMDDGSTRTLELSQPISAGTRVRVEGNSLQPL